MVMKYNIFFCDVCGKEIKKFALRGEITLMKRTTCEPEIEWDLCIACYEKLKLILESFKESKEIQL